MKNRYFIALFALLWTPLCLAGAAKDAGILPSSFNGWQKDAASATISSDPASADQADAGVLKEYGFSTVELATYTRDDRKMQVKAARFNDASGAYGAFTYYEQPQMQTEKIGDEGASNNTRILFYRGNILVDVLLDRVSAMSAADLRALSDALPQVRGNLSALPSLPANLPRKLYISHTVRYITGPVALEHLGVPIPAPLIDFNMGAEVST